MESLYSGNERFLSALERHSNPKMITFRGNLKGKRVNHTAQVGYSVFITGARSLSSHIHKLVGQGCAAEHGYAQNGQCKSCGGFHEPPNYTEIDTVRHLMMLDLLKQKGWEWKWSHNYRGQTRLHMRRGKKLFNILGVSKDMALMVATLCLCSTGEQLRSIRMHYPQLFP